MFSFGSFAQFLPYLILAITSFAGWTTYALSNFKTEATDTPSKVLSVEEKQTISDNSIASFQDFTKSVSAQNIVPARNKVAYVLINETSYPPGYLDDFPESAYFLRLYQRPPPAHFVA